MKQILLSIAFSLSFTLISAQSTDLNIELLSNVEMPETGNDIWGFVDNNGIEYAIMGTRAATRVFSLEDPTNPIERIVIPGAAGTWRDIKSFGNYAYVTADQGQDGLLIIDMTNAPDNIEFKFWKPDLAEEFDQIQIQIDTILDEEMMIDTIIVDTIPIFIDKCHNLYIDDNGICYLAGCASSNLPNGVIDGVILLDLVTDPLNPTFIANQDNRYAHDVMAQDDRMYTSDINNGIFSVYDITDPTDPILLATQSTSSNFTHNAWVSEDGNFLFTTDERPFGNVDAYDISDLNDIKFIDEYRPAETKDTPVIPHNTHYHNGYLYVSWYTDGLIVLDAHRPDNLIKVGSYDTFSNEETQGIGFSGLWGAYPFLPSGTILGSDLNSGLYVFNVNEVRASYLEGNVEDESDASPINGANIQIVAANSQTEMSNASGLFKTGYGIAGTYTVNASHPDYHDTTAVVTISEGMVEELTIKMRKKEVFFVSGTVVTDEDGNPISDAVISLISSTRNITDKTDENGFYQIEIFEEEYELHVGAWGYNEKYVGIVSPLTNLENDVELIKGYKDDFVVDLGWASISSATTGAWVRETPIGTSLGGGVTANPGFDNATDLGTMCYVTGNGEGGVGSFDVDEGVVTLYSPIMDLSNIENPVANFDYWWLNGGGEGTPDDKLTIFITDGNEETTVESFDSSQLSNGWVPYQLDIKKYVDDVSNISIGFRTSDGEQGHLVEAAIDVFLITDEVILSTEELLSADFSVFPNPANNIINITSGNDTFNNYKIFSVTGKLINAGNLVNSKANIEVSEFAEGIYYIQLFGNEGRTSAKKVVIK